MSTDFGIAPAKARLPMPGLEPDNLLAWLALLGLLRVLEHQASGWRARARWTGPPWVCELVLAEDVGPDEVAAAAARGCAALASRFDVDGRANVSFTRDELREYFGRVGDDPIASELAAALAAELPEKRGGGARPSPLVMMFGQGHQHFLERLVSVARGDVPARLRKRTNVSELQGPAKIHEALFAPWPRADETDAFRWDPEEDQRYALRFDDPSRAGAARTVHGANRLAAMGLLSYPCSPGRGVRVPGVLRRNGVSFVWPLWRPPLSRAGIVALLSRPELVEGDLEVLRPFGVVELLRARRVANGKFLNVSRAAPFRQAAATGLVGLAR